MIAQSEVRISQCQLGLARSSRRRAEAIRLIDEAEQRAIEARRLYERTPQEKHRFRDIEAILEEVERIKESRNY